MLWPKKYSCKEFDNEKKFQRSKIPLPPPHNFSNGPSITSKVLRNKNNNNIVSPEWVGN